MSFTDILRILALAVAMLALGGIITAILYCLFFWKHESNRNGEEK